MFYNVSFTYCMTWASFPFPNSSLPPPSSPMLPSFLLYNEKIKLLVFTIMLHCYFKFLFLPSRACLISPWLCPCFFSYSCFLPFPPISFPVSSPVSVSLSILMPFSLLSFDSQLFIPGILPGRLIQ